MAHWRKLWSTAVLTLAAGCASNGTFLEGPGTTPAGVSTVLEANPIFIPLGKEKYGEVFDHVYRVLDNYGFEIQESNRWDGRIETVPRTAPGLGLLIKPGSPDLRERTLATLQSYRHRVSVIIQPALQGGYFIEVQARKELEDLPHPIRSTVGSAIFRTDNNVDRQFEVIDATFPGNGWIYKGRDVWLEEELLGQIKNCQ
jgi:hypothetical protein